MFFKPIPQIELFDVGDIGGQTGGWLTFLGIEAELANSQTRE
jgi:hypothetical protein